MRRITVPCKNSADTSVSTRRASSVRPTSRRVTEVKNGIPTSKTNNLPNRGSTFSWKQPRIPRSDHMILRYTPNGSLLRYHSSFKPNQDHVPHSTKLQPPPTLQSHDAPEASEWFNGLLAFLLAAGFFTLLDQPEEVQAKQGKEGSLPTIGAVSRLPTEFMDAMKKTFQDRFVVDYETRQSRGKGQSYNVGVPPDAVVLPLNTEEVIQIMKLCSKYRVAVVPYGAGTSLEGHISALNGGVCVDFSMMRQILSVNVDDLDCVVQPGITYDELNEALREYGLFFPMDPGPGASIGGMVGTSCSGTNAVRHGTMKQNVISLTVVLPNGEVVKTAQRAKKSSAGYDLTHLFIGSEGTLGLVTEVTLKLQPIPEHKVIGLCEFRSIDDATKSVIATVQKGVQIGKVELLDEVALKAVNIYAGNNYKETPSLFFEFSGSKAVVEEQVQQVKEILKAHHGTGLQFATTKEECDALWAARKTALWAAPVLREGTEVKITDVCVPISKFAECISETKADLKKSFLLAPLVGHAGDGNFHLFILLDPNNPKDLSEAKRLDERLVHRAISLGGTCTGEHGVGSGKKEYLRMELGDSAVELMRTIKNAVDPLGIMNPGKVIPEPKGSKSKHH